MLLTRQGISLIDLFLCRQHRTSGVFLSRSLLHVAMQMGLYLHRQDADVWRVVSEDSDYFGTWLTAIHGLGDLDHRD